MKEPQGDKTFAHKKAGDEKMGFIKGFLKQRKPKQFSFQPRYYNEAQEEHDKRMKRVRHEVALENGDQSSLYVSNLKGAFRQRREEVSKIKRRANYRVLGILVALIFVLYHFIFK